MPTVTTPKSQANAVTVTAKPEIRDVSDGSKPGVRKWFQSWSGASAPAPGYTVNDQTMQYAAGAGAITLTANYGLGQTVTLTQPANGTLVNDTPLPEGASGYAPGTEITIRYVPPTGATLYQGASWTGATVDPTNPNIARVTTNFTNSVITVGLTPSVVTSRSVAMTSPLDEAITVS